MQLSELQPRQGKVDVDVTVSSLSEPRDINKPGFSGRVQDATVTDSSASVTLTLWNEHVGQFAVGDKLRVTNGWVNEFRGQMQLSAGKYGKLEKL